MQSKPLILMLASSLVLAACNKDIEPTNNGSGENTSDQDLGGPKATVNQHDDGYFKVEIAADEDWVYFDLETMTQVFPEDPDNSDIWDMGFEGAAVKLNGGVSGNPPNDEEVYVYADKVADDEPYPWDSLSTSPTFNANTWHQDEAAATDSGNPNDEGGEAQFAMATYPAPDVDPSATICGDYGWYFYNFFCFTPYHDITPRVNVAYVLRSTDCRYYRLRFTGYNSAEGLSKHPQFDVEEVPGDDCTASGPDDIELPFEF